MQNARALARLAVAGIVVYVVIDVALVFLRPRFSVLHNAESDYGSRGPYDWLKLHLLFAGIAFVAVIVGARMTTRALRPDARWRPVIVPLGVLSWGALVPVVLLAHAHLRAQSLGGLWEKVFLAVELGWFLVASAWIARFAESAAGASGPPLRDDVVDLDAGPAARPA